MFRHSIDEKPHITDPDGNEIVDLASGSFSSNGGQISNFRYARISTTFEMRPDLVAFAEYNDQNGCEFILKWTGVSNPFSLDKDDIVRIPEYDAANTAMTNAKGNDVKKENVRQQIKNYFKFVNQEYDGDMSSYKGITELSIPSGVINVSETKQYAVPYINMDDGAAVTIKNGKVYFGDGGIIDSAAMIEGSTTVSDLDKKIQSILDSTMSALSDKCLYNGMSTTSFNRAVNNSLR